MILVNNDNNNIDQGHVMTELKKNKSVLLPKLIVFHRGLMANGQLH